MTAKSIILIGMPGAGKSTIGPLLAEITGFGFVDTDELIKRCDGRDLRDIVAAEGREKFLEIQDRSIMSEEFSGCVIATGGGVVMSDRLMRYLKSLGTVIFLKQDFDTLEQRLAPGRRLAGTGGQTFRMLFDERMPLYIRFADRIVDCEGKTPEKIVQEIIEE